MENSAKAYKELYEILKFIPREKRAKIPASFITFLECNMDKKYEYKIKNVRNFEKQEMLKETKILLAILYRDYWATSEKKQEIIAKQRKEIIQQEELKRKKYDVENLFKNKR